jgi:hypothetical protein
LNFSVFVLSINNFICEIVFFRKKNTYLSNKLHKKKRIVSQLLFFSSHYLFAMKHGHRVAVSDTRRCPILVWILYDTCRNSHTSVEKVKQILPKNNVFLCFDTLWINVWQYIQTSDWKGICIFRWSNIPYIFFVKSQTRLKKLNTYWNNVINVELKTLI